MNGIILTIVSGVAVALILSIVKAFVEIQIMRREIDRLEKDRIAHETSNNNVLENIFKSMHEIEKQLNTLIGKFDK